MTAPVDSRTVDATQYTTATDGTTPTGNTQATQSSTPVASMTYADLKEYLGLPDLPNPCMEALSIETLVSALNNEARRQGVQAAVNDIEVKGDRMAAENEKKLEEIAKQLEESRNQSFWDKFCKVFQVIGAVFGAIASVATIALGAVTGNPLLIAAGVLGAIATIDSVVSLASDGKYSIAAGLTELGKAMGMSDEAAQWFAFGVQMLVTITTIALSFGAAATASSAKVADMVAKAGKALDVLAKTTTIANIGQGITGMASAVGSTGKTISAYNAAMAEANKVDIDAILERLRSIIEVDEEFVQHQMEEAQALDEACSDIVEGCAETNTAILTGCAPA